jgi:tetratricopeptide (TPR) repeat protein
MTKRSVSDLLEDISLDLNQMARDASFNRMAGLDSASMMQQAAFDQSLQMNLMQSDLEFALDDLRLEMISELERQINALKASQLPPIEAEVRELMARARDNQDHGLYQEALEDLLRAEEKQPYDYRLQDWLGSLYYQHFDDPSTALSHFDRAVRYATPRSKQAAALELLSRSLCKIALGDLHGAYEDTREALTFDATEARVLYEHSAHAALMQKNEEALSTLERAIQRAPVYWHTAERDSRLQPLGSGLSNLLNSTRARVCDALQMVLDDSHELEKTLSTWDTSARSLGPDRYDELWLPLREAEAALVEGTYLAQVKALGSAHQGLTRLVGWIDTELAAAMDQVRKEAATARDKLGSLQSFDRDEAVDALRPLVRLLGCLALFVVGLLVYIHLLVTLLSAAIMLTAGILAIKPFLSLCRHGFRLAQYMRSAKNKAGCLRSEVAAAGHHLHALQAQHESLQPYVLRWIPPKA